jgi:hypothetical protein
MNEHGNVSEANYADEEGVKNILCGACARKAGCYSVHNPCQNCIANGHHKIAAAAYRDNNGKIVLCGPCAHIAGCHSVLNPCRDCHANGNYAVGQAHYDDNMGNKCVLCAECAVKAGTHVDTGCVGASYIACRCFDRLERALGIKLPHIHYLMGGGHEGQEVKGLLPHHPHMKPDSFVPDESGKSKGSVYQFHGNEYHGYPPGHEKHATLLSGSKKWGPDAYGATLAKDRLYLEAGYRVFVTWEHEFMECERQTCPRNVTEVCREFLGEHT